MTDRLDAVDSDELNLVLFFTLKSFLLDLEFLDEVEESDDLSEAALFDKLIESNSIHLLELDQVVQF